MDEKAKTYGNWGGNPKGIPENKNHCIKEVFSGNCWYSHQCPRKRCFGKGGLYCKQHAKNHPEEEKQ